MPRDFTAARAALAENREAGICRTDRARARDWRRRTRPYFDSLYGPEPPRADMAEAQRGREFARRWREGRRDEVMAGFIEAAVMRPRPVVGHIPFASHRALA